MPSTPRTIGSFVTDQLRKQILDGALRPGERLLPDELADSFEVSRIPVREALRQLEAEGLVTIYPRRGAVVSELSLDQLQDISDIRALLEVTALRSAIGRMDKQHLAGLERLVSEMEASEGDLGHWLDLNRQFHAALYKPSQREFLLGLIDSLRAQCDRYLRLNAAITGLASVSDDEHRQLLDACRRRDVDGASSILTAHIKRSVAELVEFLGAEAANSIEVRSGEGR